MLLKRKELKCVMKLQIISELWAKILKKNLVLAIKAFSISIIISLFTTCLIFWGIIATVYFENTFPNDLESFFVFSLLFIVLIPFSEVFIFKKLFKNKYLMSVPFSFVLGLAYVAIYAYVNYSRIILQSEGIMSGYSNSIGMSLLVISFAVYCVSGWIAYFLLKDKK